jgi:hypothetical protein
MTTSAIAVPDVAFGSNSTKLKVSLMHSAFGHVATKALGGFMFHTQKSRTPVQLDALKHFFGAHQERLARQRDARGRLVGISTASPREFGRRGAQKVWSRRFRTGDLARLIFCRKIPETIFFSSMMLSPVHRRRTRALHQPGATDCDRGGGRSISGEPAPADRPHSHSGIFFSLIKNFGREQPDRFVTSKGTQRKNHCGIERLRSCEKERANKYVGHDEHAEYLFSATFETGNAALVQQCCRLSAALAQAHRGSCFI